MNNLAIFCRLFHITLNAYSYCSSANVFIIRVNINLLYYKYYKFIIIFSILIQFYYSAPVYVQLLVNVYRADAALLPAAAAVRRDGASPTQFQSQSQSISAVLGGYFDERLLFHIQPSDHKCASFSCSASRSSSMMLDARRTIATGHVAPENVEQLHVGGACGEEKMPKVEPFAQYSNRYGC